MPPLEPIAETAEAAEELAGAGGGAALLAELSELADRAQEFVPDLVGVTIARLEEQLAFTLVASAEEAAVLDGIQYLAGGPRVEGGKVDELREFHGDDLFDEERWQFFSAATAARAVRSTLTLPVMGDGVVGTINLYGASPRAFEGHHEQLAEIFGAWAEGAVTNADLPFRTRADAEEAPARVREQKAIDIAVGILGAQLRVDPATAAGRLREAAGRAGVSAAELARTIVRAREERGSAADER